MADLKLVPLDELIAEVQCRHIASVLLFMQQRTEVDGDVMVKVSGNRATCIGMLGVANAYLTASVAGTLSQ